MCVLFDSYPNAGCFKFRFFLFILNIYLSPKIYTVTFGMYNIERFVVLRTVIEIKTVIVNAANKLTFMARVLDLIIFLNGCELI